MQPIGNVQQVGGTHYGTKFGHWDYCKLARTPYLEGAATKYLFRWRDKGGVQDLKKALTFVQKLAVNAVQNPDRHNLDYGQALETLFNENEIPAMERILMQAIFTWRTVIDLRWVEDELIIFIKDQEAYEATKSYVNQG